MTARTPNQREPDDARAPEGRRRATLLALGSATVLSIYSAGFVRTRAAASRITEQESTRHPLAADTAGRHDALSVAPAPSPLGDTVRFDTSGKVAVVASPKSTPAKPVQVAQAPHPDTAVPAASEVVAVQPPPPSTPAPVQPADTATAPPPAADTAHAAWKDGTYSGWGTSRHGDIEATVEIRSGHIISANISQCRTRYSCSRIAELPPQVLARQSAEVDYVSGATQSSDAYYYAVLEALKKAK